jgi:hypothetical protein
MRSPFRALLEWYYTMNMRPPITAALIVGICALLAALIKAPASKPIQAKIESQVREASAKPAVATSPVQEAKPTDPYEFAQAVIDSLSWAADARQTVMSLPAENQGPADTLKSMTNARIAINKLTHARLKIQRFADSDNELVNETASLFDTAYHALIVALNASIRTEEQLMSVSSEQELGVLLNEASKWAAQADESWKALVYASAGVAHVLADKTRSTKDGKLAYLTITTEQRAKLLQQLESHFGESIKQGMQAGQHATEAAPAALWEWLSRPGWRPADAQDF